MASGLITSWQIGGETMETVVLVQSLSRVWLYATPWTAVCHDSLSFTISWSLLKLMSIELVMPSNLAVHGVAKSLTWLSDWTPKLRSQRFSSPREKYCGWIVPESTKKETPLKRFWSVWLRVWSSSRLSFYFKQLLWLLPANLKDKPS